MAIERPDTSSVNRYFLETPRKLIRRLEMDALRQAGKMLRDEMQQLAPDSGDDREPDIRKEMYVRSARQRQQRARVLVTVEVPYAQKIDEIYDFREKAIAKVSPQVERVIERTIQTELS